MSDDSGVCRTFRYRLYPTRRQHDLLTAMLRDHATLYNAALQERRDAWASGRHRVTYRDQQAQLTEVRRADEQYRRWACSSEQLTLRRLDRAFQAFFRRCKMRTPGVRPGYPRFRSWRRFDTVSWTHGDGSKWLPEVRRLRLQGVGEVKVRVHRPARGTVKQVSVTRRGRHWYVQLACVGVPRQLRPLTGAMVGLDMGVTHLVATSDGELIGNPRSGAAEARRLARAQRTVARRKRGSSRRAKAVEEVAAIHRRSAARRRHVLHEISRRLVDTCDVIAVEDLRITNMVRSGSGTKEQPGTRVAQKTGLNRSILDAGWGVLIGMLEYKAEEAGVVVVPVDPRNTSRSCPRCGHVAAGNRHKEQFRCQRCGYTAHADVNAAQTILGRAATPRNAAVSGRGGIRSSGPGEASTSRTRVRAG